MSNALTVVPPHEADIFAGDRLKLIRDKFANGAPQHEFDIFIEVCRTLRLDPLQRQVHLIPRNSKQRDGTYAKTWTIQTSIDGYRAIADRTGAYAGSDDAIFTEGDGGKPATATVTVWKIVQGTRCPFTATARWAEYADDRSPMWGRMPHTMLAKCSEALALRKAFPAQLSGVYTDSEMEQAGPVVREGRVVDASTGEIIEAQTREVAPERPRAVETDQDAGPGANAAHRTRQPSTEPITIRDPDSPLTDKQRGMIWGTAEGKGLTDAMVHALAGVASVNDLTKGAASQFIDRLMQTDGTVLQREAAKLTGQTEMEIPADESAGTDDDEPTELVSWTAFWQECRALGVKSPADFEARVGAKQTAYPSPAAALAALKGTEQG